MKLFAGLSLLAALGLGACAHPMGGHQAMAGHDMKNCPMMQDGKAMPGHAGMMEGDMHANMEAMHGKGMEHSAMGDCPMMRGHEKSGSSEDSSGQAGH